MGLHVVVANPPHHTGCAVVFPLDVRQSDSCHHVVFRPLLQSVRKLGHYCIVLQRTTLVLRTPTMSCLQSAKRQKWKEPYSLPLCRAKRDSSISVQEDTKPIKVSRSAMERLNTLLHFIRPGLRRQPQQLPASSQSFAPPHESVEGTDIHLSHFASPKLRERSIFAQPFCPFSPGAPLLSCGASIFGFPSKDAVGSGLPEGAQWPSTKVSPSTQ